jgi:hypothetical protein
LNKISGKIQKQCKYIQGRIGALNFGGNCWPKKKRSLKKNYKGPLQTENFQISADLKKKKGSWCWGAHDCLTQTRGAPWDFVSRYMASPPLNIYIKVSTWTFREILKKKLEKVFFCRKKSTRKPVKMTRLRHACVSIFKYILAKTRSILSEHTLEYECGFSTQSVIFTHSSVINLRMSVTSTRLSVISTRRVRFLHARVWNQLKLT